MEKPKEEEKKEQPSKCSQCFAWYNKHSFLINAVFVITMAYVYPPFAGDYLAPNITSSYIAVIIIFILSGISLKSSELKKAVGNCWFNIFVQLWNLGLVPLLCYGLSRILISTNLLNIDLSDGIVIGASLPMTVNMVIVFTKSAGGDEAAALLNASLGNLMGVFVTPALIMLYLGQESNIDFGAVVLKLCYRILIPVIAGQLL